MSLPDIISPDLAEAAQDLHARQQPFAFATIVRTAGPTAAKPGARALVGMDGTILHGWLGGGCTRGAVKRAVVQALTDATPRLISVAPEDLLAEKGIAPGDEVDGVRFAKNGCPSRGSVDVFIEPCLPMPALVVLGASPVAQMLAELAPRFQWAVSGSVPEDAPAQGQTRVAVIATQGQGDMDALKSVLSGDFDYVAFVGSGRKFASLSDKLEAAGVDRAAIDAVKAPAGLDIGAISPEEIALSILAELISVRRQFAGRPNA